MPSYTAPLKDMNFVLHDVLKVEASETEGYSELSPDFTSAVLEEAGKICRLCAGKRRRAHAYRFQRCI